MSAVVFNCPICGGPIRSEEKRGRGIWYSCQNKKCKTKLYQSYDKNKSCYADRIYLSGTNRSGTRNKIWGLYWGKELTAEQWKRVSDGESIPGFKPSTKETEAVSMIQASAGFRTLLGYGQFIAGCGWALIFLATIVLIVGLVGSIIGTVVGLASSIALDIVGIGFVVSGQVISCFVSIERNTRETNELLKQLNK